MKRTILAMLVIILIAGAVATPTTVAIQKVKYTGMWGFNHDPDPAGTFKGYYFPNGRQFVGKVFYSDKTTVIGIKLRNDGSYVGYLLYLGINHVINGKYNIQNGIITASWHCLGHSGWLVGQK